MSEDSEDIGWTMLGSSEDEDHLHKSLQSSHEENGHEAATGDVKENTLLSGSDDICEDNESRCQDGNELEAAGIARSSCTPSADGELEAAGISQASCTPSADGDVEAASISLSSCSLSMDGELEASSISQASCAPSADGDIIHEEGNAPQDHPLSSETCHENLVMNKSSDSDSDWSDIVLVGDMLVPDAHPELENACAVAADSESRFHFIHALPGNNRYVYARPEDVQLPGNHRYVYARPEEDIQSEASDVDDRVESDISGCALDSDIDLSTISYDADQLEVDPGSVVRSYRHRPNSSLNSLLSILALLTLAVTVGIGIGHYLGTTHQLMLKGQRGARMMELQDEYLQCLRDRDLLKTEQSLTDKEKISAVTAVWKSKFDEIILENVELRYNLDKLKEETARKYQIEASHTEIPLGVTTPNNNMGNIGRNGRVVIEESEVIELEHVDSSPNVDVSNQISQTVPTDIKHVGTATNIDMPDIEDDYYCSEMAEAPRLTADNLPVTTDIDMSNVDMDGLASHPEMKQPSVSFDDMSAAVDRGHYSSGDAEPQTKPSSLNMADRDVRKQEELLEPSTDGWNGMAWQPSTDGRNDMAWQPSTDDRDHVAWQPSTDDRDHMAWQPSTEGWNRVASEPSTDGRDHMASQPSTEGWNRVTSQPSTDGRNQIGPSTDGRNQIVPSDLLPLILWMIPRLAMTDLLRLQEALPPHMQTKAVIDQINASLDKHRDESFTHSVTVKWKELESLLDVQTGNGTATVMSDNYLNITSMLNMTNEEYNKHKPGRTDDLPGELDGASLETSFSAFMNQTYQSVTSLSRRIGSAWKRMKNRTGDYIKNKKSLVKFGQSISNGLTGISKMVKSGCRKALKYIKQDKQHLDKDSMLKVKPHKQDKKQPSSKLSQPPTEEHSSPPHPRNNNKDTLPATEDRSSAPHPRNNNRDKFGRKSANKVTDSGSQEESQPATEERSSPPHPRNNNRDKFGGKSSNKVTDSGSQEESWEEALFSTKYFLEDSFLERNNRKWNKHEKRARKLHGRLQKLTEDAVLSMDDDDVDDIFDDLEDLREDVSQVKDTRLMTWLTCQVRWWKSRLYRRHSNEDLIRGCGQQLLHWQLTALCHVCPPHLKTKMCTSKLQGTGPFCNYYHHVITSAQALVIDSNEGDQQTVNDATEAAFSPTDQVYTEHTFGPQYNNQLNGSSLEPSVKWMFERAEYREALHHDGSWMFKRQAKRDFQRTKPWYYGRADERAYKRSI